MPAIDERFAVMSRPNILLALNWKPPFNYKKRGSQHQSGVVEMLVHRLKLWSILMWMNLLYWKISSHFLSRAIFTRKATNAVGEELRGLVNIRSCWSSGHCVNLSFESSTFEFLFRSLWTAEKWAFSLPIRLQPAISAIKSGATR